MRLLGLFFTFFLFAATIFSQTVWQKHQSPTSDTLHNAFFVSERNGWAISHQSGLVLQTKNGGKTWTILARLGESYLESIYFVDKKHGWICGENGRVFNTSNGGKNWKLIESFAKSNAFSAVHFFDKNHGFVFGFDIETRQSLIFETLDGGKNWLNRSAEIKDKTNLSDAVFRFDKNSFVIGGNFLLRGEKSKKDFELLETKQSGTIRGLFFTNQKIGWAIGHRGLILQTKDGGKTWEKRESFTNSILRSVNFIDEKRGFIVGNRNENGVSMWQTADGGETWQAVKNDFPNLHRIVSNRKRLWLFGAEGSIFSSGK